MVAGDGHAVAEAAAVSGVRGAGGALPRAPKAARREISKKVNPFPAMFLYTRTGSRLCATAFCAIVQKENAPPY